jgi:hypothetical protein
VNLLTAGYDESCKADDGAPKEATMTEMALKLTASSSRRKRARRFWGAMAATLRQASPWLSDDRDARIFAVAGKRAGTHGVRYDLRAWHGR